MDVLQGRAAAAAASASSLKCVGERERGNASFYLIFRDYVRGKGDELTARKRESRLTPMNKLAFCAYSVPSSRFFMCARFNGQSRVIVGNKVEILILWDVNGPFYSLGDVADSCIHHFFFFQTQGFVVAVWSGDYFISSGSRDEGVYVINVSKNKYLVFIGE